MSFNMQEKEQLIKNFQVNSTDTGSVEVQVAIISARIDLLTGHLKENNKDFSSKHGLIRLVSQRRKLLNYLKNKNEARYQALIGRLGLKR